MGKVAANNKKAYFDYEIIETIEAGIVLVGTEVKSIRQGKLTIKESFVRIKDDLETFLMQAHISHYEHGNIHNHEEVRPRKMLLKKTQIRRLYGKTKEKGLSIVPLKVYFTRGKVKVLLGLAKGKKLHDKRHAIKKRDIDRDTKRQIASI